MIRVVVTGGRTLSSYRLVSQVLDGLDDPVALLAHGDATGADSLADEWARLKGVPRVKFPVGAREWETVGKRSGPLRNCRMLDMVRPDVVIAFPGGRGTANCVKEAKRRRIKVIEVIPEAPK